MIEPTIIDVETTTLHKGHPFNEANRLCYIGYKSDSVGSRCLPVEYSNQFAYGPTLGLVSNWLLNSQLFVAFNSKFDIHWLRRYGVRLPPKLPVWDLQLAEFIIGRQKNPFPSLESSCQLRDLVGKIDRIKTEYWDKGIDTPQVPQEVLEEYLDQDLKSEEALFWAQVKYLKDKLALKRLIWHACQDLLVTEEMEWNGLKFDLERSRKIGDEKLNEVKVLDGKLSALVANPNINWGSGQHISAVLYGGEFSIDGREDYTFTYKTGKTAIKFRKVEIPQKFERLVEPLKGTKLKEEGYFETNEGVLQSLRAKGSARKIIKLVLERKGLLKSVSTYFHGFPKLYKEMQWSDNLIHGQLNHCRAVTGRLSSSKPNQQNLEPEIRKCIVTRFQ